MIGTVYSLIKLYVLQDFDVELEMFRVIFMLSILLLYICARVTSRNASCMVLLVYRPGSVTVDACFSQTLEIFSTDLLCLLIQSCW